MKAIRLVVRAARNQRVAVIAATVLAIGCAGAGITFGYALVGVFAAVGVALGVGNILITEVTMIRMLDRGDGLSRREFGFSSLGRLAVITAAALVTAAVFWPNGIGTFFGLAIFQPLALVLTGLPVLKELRKGGDRA